MHFKRQRIPKNWSIHRKGTKYVVRPRVDIQRGVPVLVALRDLLGIAQTRKEVKRAIHLKHILLNGKPVTDEKNSVLLFDVITLVPSKKKYRLDLSEKGKLQIDEISDKESNEKIAKIKGKKVLKGKKIQLNLGDGRNFISDIKTKTNDSVLIDLKNGKISKHLPMKEGANIVVFAGKHSGKKGPIKKLDLENATADIEFEGKSIKVLIKQLIVVK